MIKKHLRLIKTQERGSPDPITPKKARGQHLNSTVYRLKITLNEITPPIWRMVLVPGSLTLRQVHFLIQTVMGWENRHLHSFDIDGNKFGEPHPEDADFNLHFDDERKFRIGELELAVGKHFFYI